MALDPALLEILRCPDEHHAQLEWDTSAQTLTCVECGRTFEVRDGIPVLLLDESRPSQPVGTTARPDGAAGDPDCGGTDSDGAATTSGEAA